MIYRNPLKRLYNASIYSLEGLSHAIKNEQAFRYEFTVFVILCAVLVLTPVKLGLMRSLFIIAMWLAVMALELVNSAVEKAFDLIDEHYRPEIKAGKDMLSSAVFIMVCFNIFTWAALIINTCIY